jgi:ribonuclease E
MRLDRHKRAVERALRDALRKHKERARLLRMSAFGLIEMTRQRQGPSLKRNIYFDCPHCRGSGLVKMPESVILDVVRIIQLAAHHDHVRKITVSVAADVSHRLLNKKRALLAQIESETGKAIVIRGDANFTSDQIEFVCEDDRGQLVPLGNAVTAAPERTLPREPAGNP